MRRSMFQATAVTLACLLMAGTSQAQFGKLKDLAKEKLGTNKDAQKTAAAPAAANSTSVEVKATYAAGVKKSLNVTRKSAGTAEAVVSPAEIGRSQVVTIKVSNVDATQFEAVRTNSPCNKLTSFQILSATQVKVTLDLTEDKSAGSCQLYFVSNGKVVSSADLTIRGKK